MWNKAHQVLLQPRTTAICLLEFWWKRVVAVRFTSRSLLLSENVALQGTAKAEMVQPLDRKPQTADAPITLDFGSSTLNRDSNDSDDGVADESGLETYASYGQLVGPPSYEESVLYDSVVNASNENGETSAAAFVATPPLTVKVCDPQKREQSTIFGMQSKYGVQCARQ